MLAEDPRPHRLGSPVECCQSSLLRIGEVLRMETVVNSLFEGEERLHIHFIPSGAQFHLQLCEEILGFIQGIRCRQALGIMDFWLMFHRKTLAIFGRKTKG